ncbi:MAG: hypothetical protein HQM11_05565 [SAR324 cluster bacterium]|nr:hypothetical protein [SAR324 cluster bacterium]
MKYIFGLIVLIFLIHPGIEASEKIDYMNAIPVDLSVSTTDNEFVYSPDLLVFETEKLYKLVMKNSGRLKHVFCSKYMEDSVTTHKIVVLDFEKYPVAEMFEGSVCKFIIFPDNHIEWYFTPKKPGSNFDITCYLPGHEEMRGKVQIVINPNTIK